MSKTTAFSLNPIGCIRSPLKVREDAPRQGFEGAPDAWLEVIPCAVQCLEGLAVGDDIKKITAGFDLQHDVRKHVEKSDETNQKIQQPGRKVVADEIRRRHESMLLAQQAHAISDNPN